MCWTGDIAIEEVLAAGERLRRTLAGQDLPAWGEPERPAKGAPDRLAKSRPAVDQPAGDLDSRSPNASQPPDGRPSEDPAAAEARLEDPAAAGGPPARDPLVEDAANEDPLAEDELRATEADVCPPMPASEVAGHVRMLPGPALAAWLGQARPGQMDEAALVNSITGWRKLTSWAQAQELAAVAELGRRRGVMDDPELERDPIRELSAEFAPNEVALALTLTHCAAQWWMNLAVSVSRRLPATWSALSEGTIDLGRAKLIDMWTTPLDDDLAQAVERKVLVRAGRQTTGQLRASLQRAVISVDPAAAERRRAEAERNARVELSGEDSGTAALSGHFLPAAQASAAWARISGLAEAMKLNGAGGGIDLLRAQVFIGLLLGTSPQPPDQPAPGNSDPPGGSPECSGARPGDGSTNAPGGDHGEDPGSGPQRKTGRSAGTGTSSGTGSGSETGTSDSTRGGVNSRDECPPPWNDEAGTGQPPGPPDEPPWSWPPIPMPDEVPCPGAGTRTTKIRRPELSVSWRTLAGWWDEPGQLTRMGPITAAVARELARVAAADPTCVWRVVVTDANGQVMAVTRVRWPGRPHRKSGHPPGSGARPPDEDAHPPGPAVESGVPGPGVLGRITVTVPVMLLGEPPPAALAGLNASAGSGTSPGLVAALRAILTAAAAAAGEVDRLDEDHVDGDHVAPCAHANAAPGYRIPDRMRDLIEVRDQDCGFPICRRPASRCDLDHTVPYDQGGLTCPCNISGMWVHPQAGVSISCRRQGFLGCDTEATIQSLLPSPTALFPDSGVPECRRGGLLGHQGGGGAFREPETWAICRSNRAAGWS